MKTSVLAAVLPAPLVLSGALAAAEMTRGTPWVASSTGTGEVATPLDGCPANAFSDDGICVSFPDDDGEAPALDPEENMHRERSGRWAIYEQIPRRPERPESYDRYVYPTPPGVAGGHSVISGYDLDLADERQRRGRKLRAVGHGGVDLPNPRGTPVKVVRLEHEQSDPEVLYVGHLFGNTVITKHSVREAGRLREYVLLHGHLDRPAEGLRPHAVLHEGDILGYVGDSDSKSLVHLHLEARRVREGVDLFDTPPSRYLDRTVVCDPRNVLTLRDPQQESGGKAGDR